MTINASAPAGRPDSAPGHRRRVLLVEDAAVVRRAAAVALRAAGFDVTAVGEAAQALAVVGTVDPDVLVTDSSTPGQDGLELVRTLRVRGVGVPVLVLSARDAAADRVGAFDAGADAFLATPFGLGDLSSRVTALARTHARP